MLTNNNQQPGSTSPAAQDLTLDPSGGVFDSTPPTDVAGALDQPGQGVSPEPEPSAVPPTAPVVQPATAAPQPTLTPDQVLAVLKQAGELQAQTAPTPAPKPQPTQAELEAQFNVYKPDQRLVKRLLNAENPEEVVSALTEFRDGLTRQMVTIQQAQIAAALQPTQQRLQELTEFQTRQESFMSEMENERFEKTFYTENPELVQYKPVVEAVMAKMGEVKGSARERRVAYAEATKQTLAACNLPVTAVSATSTTPVRTAPTRANGGMATLTSGGHPGNRTAPKAKQYTGPYGAAHEVLDWKD